MALITTGGCSTNVYWTPNITTTWDTCSSTVDTSAFGPFSNTWQPVTNTYRLVTTTNTCASSTTPYITTVASRLYACNETQFYWNVNATHWPEPKKTLNERIREIVHRRMQPDIITNCKPLGQAEDIREIRARETLRNVIGEEKFRDFARRGSISVRAKSGLTYQIFPGSGFTNVYNNGKMLDRLCVVLTGGFPPTDSLIMRYLMILNNEEQFKSLAIKHGTVKPVVAEKADQRPLAEIFKDLKKVA